MTVYERTTRSSVLFSLLMTNRILWDCEPVDRGEGEGVSAGRDREITD